jgi:hypothetical protein
MHQQQEPARDNYPHGRGYGHDYMRGGEVLDGYGYSSRPEYARRRGDADEATDDEAGSGSEVVNS